MNDITAQNWNELHDLLFEGSWKQELGRYRSDYAFCGISDASYHLKTSLMMLGGEYDRLEGHLLRNFRKYAKLNVVTGDSIWNWLALAQHHGLPTRLTDWTYSPYVALHFATDDPSTFIHDGAIWCVDYVRCIGFLPQSLKRVLNEEGSYVFTAEMLQKAAGSLVEFDRLSKKQFVTFFEPPSLDERIINQFALFSFMSSPTTDLEKWLIEKPNLYRRIILPASLKQEVRDKLDQANITERVLFPGLDGLSAWLKRYYSPRKR